MTITGASMQNSKQIRDLDFPQLHWLDKQNRPNDYFPELKGRVILSSSIFMHGLTHFTLKQYTKVRIQ